MKLISCLHKIHSGVLNVGTTINGLPLHNISYENHLLILPAEGIIKVHVFQSEGSNGAHTSFTTYLVKEVTHRFFPKLGVKVLCLTTSLKSEHLSH